MRKLSRIPVMSLPLSRWTFQVPGGVHASRTPSQSFTSFSWYWSKRPWTRTRAPMVWVPRGGRSMGLGSVGGVCGSRGGVCATARFPLGCSGTPAEVPGPLDAEWSSCLAGVGTGGGGSASACWTRWSSASRRPWGAISKGPVGCIVVSGDVVHPSSGWSSHVPPRCRRGTASTLLCGGWGGPRCT